MEGDEDRAVAEAAAEATERRSRLSLGGGKTPCSRVVDAHRWRGGLFGGDGGEESLSAMDGAKDAGSAVPAAGRLAGWPTGGPVGHRLPHVGHAPLALNAAHHLHPNCVTCSLLLSSVLVLVMWEGGEVRTREDRFDRRPDRAARGLECFVEIGASEV